MAAASLRGAPPRRVDEVLELLGRQHHGGGRSGPAGQRPGAPLRPAARRPRRGTPAVKRQLELEPRTATAAIARRHHLDLAPLDGDRSSIRPRTSSASSSASRRASRAIGKSG
jgi:hypothetical protein